MNLLCGTLLKNDNGVIGLLTTMLALFMHCIDKGLQYVWVLEDDAMFMNDPGIITEAMSQVPNDFDLLYFGGYLTHEQNTVVHKNIFKVSRIFSTHSIYYSREAMIKILAALKETFNSGYYNPYDKLLFNGIQKEGKCYCAYPAVMKQRAGYSDIEKNVVDYTRYHEDMFRENTCHLKFDNLL